MKSKFDKNEATHDKAKGLKDRNKLNNTEK